MVLADHTTQGVLVAVTVLARRTLPGCLAASITLVHEGRPATHVCDGDVAGDADSWQYEAGDGPCLAAIRDATTVRVDSFADEPRWPAFASQALGSGIHSSLSIPLVVHAEVAGAAQPLRRRGRRLRGQRDGRLQVRGPGGSHPRQRQGPLRRPGPGRPAGRRPRAPGGDRPGDGDPHGHRAGIRRRRHGHPPPGVQPGQPQGVGHRRRHRRPSGQKPELSRATSPGLPGRGSGGRPPGP